MQTIDPQETCAGQDFRDAKMNQCGQRLRDRSPRGRSQPERVRRIGAPMNVSEKVAAFLLLVVVPFFMIKS